MSKSSPAISVNNLGKMYRLSHLSGKAESFREAITSAVLGPFRRLRQLSGRDESMEEFWALKDVSFEFQPGEVVGIIGRNGAGKSTLLKVLSQIVEPTVGEVILRGRVASLLEVGTGFHPELTGRENIFLNGSILGMKKREIVAKFDEIVAFAEVDKFLDTPVKRYSSGMYVRLAFAVAAHLDPEILIVDEVLAVGDAEFQKKCLGKMREVAKGSGRTVLFVSHNMAAVESLCTRGLLLSAGSVSMQGTASEAVAAYRHLGLAGVPRLSQIKGTVMNLDSAEMVGSDGLQIKSLEDAFLKLTITPNLFIHSFGFQLFFETADGTQIGDIDSYPTYTIGSMESNRTYSVSIRLQSLPFRVGEYRMRMVLRDDHHFRGLEVDDPLLFEVNDNVNLKKNCRHGSRFGLVAVDYEVDYRCIS